MSLPKTGIGRWLPCWTLKPIVLRQSHQVRRSNPFLAKAEKENDMGLFDDIAGQLGGQMSQALGAGGVASALQGAGGLSGVLETLSANGLAEHVESWAGDAHLPVSAEQIQAALGDDKVQQLAQASGLPVGDFLSHLAEHLPAAAANAQA